MLPTGRRGEKTCSCAARGGHLAKSPPVGAASTFLQQSAQQVGGSALPRQGNWRTLSQHQHLHFFRRTGSPQIYCTWVGTYSPVSISWSTRAQLAGARVAMVLYVIGLGLGDEKDITVRGLEAVRGSAKVVLEHYTSILGVDKAKLVSTRQMRLASGYWCSNL